jgi:hypothetical protein
MIAKAAGTRVAAAHRLNQRCYDISNTGRHGARMARRLLSNSKHDGSLSPSGVSGERIGQRCENLNLIGQLYPRNEAEISAVMDWAGAVSASLTPFGGGSSVCGGVEPRVDGIRCRAAVTLDLRNFGTPLTGSMRLTDPWPAECRRHEPSHRTRAPLSLRRAFRTSPKPIK